MMDWQKTSANIQGARHSLYAPDFRECNSTSVDKTQGYLDEWYPVIESTIDIVRQCLSVECMVERMKKEAEEMAPRAQWI